MCFVDIFELSAHKKTPEEKQNFHVREKLQNILAGSHLMCGEFWRADHIGSDFLLENIACTTRAAPWQICHGHCSGLSSGIQERVRLSIEKRITPIGFCAREHQKRLRSRTESSDRSISLQTHSTQLPAKQSGTGPGVRDRAG